MRSLADGEEVTQEKVPGEVPIAGAAGGIADDAAGSRVEEPELAVPDAVDLDITETLEEEINLMQPPPRAKKAKKGKSTERSEEQQLSDFNDEVRHAKIGRKT